MRPVRSVDDAAGGFTRPGLVMGIVRAGLPDRGALPVAEPLPGGVTGRARLVRPARRRPPRVTGGRARGARDGTAPGAVTHPDRPRARAHAGVSR